MPINELLIEEFDREMSNTRKVLERVPEEKWEWRPHDTFDRAVEDTRKALAAVTDEQLRQPWKLTNNGQPIFTLPRYHALRAMCFNHVIHHRAQLTIYFRLLGVPVPGLYGPSADETVF